ncbi:hypothetical protein CLV50_0198 [Flavobacterium lindanitolerans]|uniref:Uncharacterized protein n=1 Tax=Flavobacterium lindanitolerans TaxID=428988 RepID=A0A497UYB0_9FLAO|nr:hypothetical protein B0G92_1306 [Flavobacterium lindanitolerans]RLJ34837.1 hypothetical protein CLV50_0198 [Flavobacterium lindanitolerans]
MKARHFMCFSYYFDCVLKLNEHEFFISNCDRFFGFANAQEEIKFDVSGFEFYQFWQRL